MRNLIFEGDDERFNPEVDAFYHNLTAVDPDGTFAATYTAGAAHTKGVVTTVLPALATDINNLQVMLGGGNAASTLVDVMHDPAGGTNWSVLIADLIGSFMANFGDDRPPQGCRYEFPIFIKAGTSLGVRSQSSSAGGTGRCIMIASRQSTKKWIGTGVETIGIDSATSLGVLHTAGSTGAFSTWANIGTPLTKNARYLQMGLGGGGLTIMNAVGYIFQLGVGGVPITGSDMFAVTMTSERLYTLRRSIGHFVPAGTQLQIRGKTEGTAQQLDLAAYAVY